MGGNRRLWWGFAAVLATAVLLLWPLRLAISGLGLEAAGLSARAVRGSMWSGELDAAGFRGARLGDVTLRLAPLALLAGRVEWRISGDALRGAGFRAVDGGGVTELSGRLALDGLAGLPVAGFELDAVGIAFAGGACRSAAGRVTAIAGPALGDEGGLTGQPRCDGRYVLLPLVSASGLARLDLRIAADGGYRAALALEGGDEARRAALLGRGFQPTPQGLALQVEGQL